jgi:hypothetical protein
MFVNLIKCRRINGKVYGWDCAAKSFAEIIVRHIPLADCPVDVVAEIIEDRAVNSQTDALTQEEIDQLLSAVNTNRK